jgi:glycosyltransferase involved in cell wall biosynthesis
MKSELNASRQPLVSVIIPAYNAADYIGQALQSVFDQTYPHYEIIVVDDGSTDNTKTVLENYGSSIRYVYQQNGGPAQARNAGILAAKGDLVCFLDADDLWMRDKLEVQLDFMKSHPEIGLVCSDHEDFEGEETICNSFLGSKQFLKQIASEIPIYEAFRKLVIENFVSTSTVMVKKPCLDKVGPFDRNLPPVEDRDMWLRIAAHFPIACLPRIVCRKRAHAGNISRDAEKTLRARIIIWEQKCRGFPHLVPASVLNRLLADAYLHYGYVLLNQNRRKEAREAAWKGLVNGFRSIDLVAANEPVTGYRWRFGIGLIPLTFLPPSFLHSLSGFYKRG